MGLALAEAIAAHSDRELISIVVAIKDFHPTAFALLPAEVIARLS